jgi:hypothetical protein
MAGEATDMVRSQHNHVLAAILCVAMPLMPQTVGAQTAVARQGLDADYRKAVSVFQSADTLKAEPLLDGLITRLSQLDDVLTPAERQIMAQVLGLRAQLRFDLDRQSETAADLTWLFELDQDHRFDNSVSPRLVQVWNQIRRDMPGRIRLPTKANAKVWIDGNRVDGVPVLAAVPGQRELVIHAGNRRETTVVQVPANREVSVTLTETPNRFVQVFVHPPRIVLIRFGGAMEVATQSFRCTARAVRYRLNTRRFRLNRSRPAN